MVVINELLIFVYCLLVIVNHNVLVKYTSFVNHKGQTCVYVYVYFYNIGGLVLKVGGSVVTLPTIVSHRIIRPCALGSSVRE